MTASQPGTHASPCETNLTFRHEHAGLCHSFVVSGLTRLSFSVRVTERHSYWRPAMEQPGCFPTVEFDRSKLMIRIEVTLNADPTAIGPVVEGIMEMARRLECAAGKEFEIE